METTELPVEQVDDDNKALWINHRLTKAFLAGIIIGSGLAVAFPIINNFMIQPETMTQEIVISAVAPIIIVYFWADSVKKLLTRYGFEGFENRQDNTMKIPQLVIGMIGLFLGVFIVGIFIYLFQNIGEETTALILRFILGALFLAFIFWMRSRIRRA